MANSRYYASLWQSAASDMPSTPAMFPMSTMLPDVIVVRGRDVSPLLRAAWPSGVPVVTVTNGLSDDPALLVEAIRDAIRSSQRPRN